MWKISIDTGGTFTDCIALNPEGNVRKLKVLSSGEIKGRMLSYDQGWFQSDLLFNFTNPVFKNYKIKCSNADTTFNVNDFDPNSNSFQFDMNQEVKFPFDFTLTANEEAPLLATRILTETSLGDKFPEIELKLGTTKGTNALLEKKGCKTALLITKGFKDLLYIGSQQRPNLFQLDIPEPELLYHSVYEIEERVDAQGNILIPLNEDAYQAIIEKLLASNYEAVAISLMNSYKNNSHEKFLKKVLDKAGLKYVSVSSELHPFIHILPRTRTAVTNAYLQPIINDYLNQIQEFIPNLMVMSSSGGLESADAFHPKDGLLSGPAGGVLGASNIAKQFGIHKILTLDMGGTSTDCARYNQGFDYSFETKIGQQTIAVPTVDIETVAAGGGSICSFDGYKLTVGPESAGASPGPACYGAGGPLTITDVNLLLGRLETTAFGIPININAAENRLKDIIHQINDQLGTKHDKFEILHGFIKIANEKMANAIRKISVSKGFNPKGYTLMAFGGAGGLHICDIADLLEVENIIIPYDAGILSAKGIHHAEIEKWSSKQILLLFDEMGDIDAIIQKEEKKLVKKFLQEGFEENEILIKQKLIYLRLLGQSNTIELDFSLQLEQDFKTKYKALFGHYPKNSKIEIESIKVIASTHKNTIQRIKPITKDNLSPISRKNRKFNWDELQKGNIIEGKGVLYNELSSVYIQEGWEAIIQENKDLLLSKTSQIQKDEKENETIALELFTNRFMAIAEKTGLQLQRTSFSVNIKERLDFSCAILDAKAELLANAPHIPVHLGSLGVCARMILKEYPLEEGDVIITNHPKYGGSHLPDVTLISAVFDDNSNLIGYVINRAHHAEIGGNRPGSMPPDAINLEEEGVVIPPIYLAKSGKVQWEKIISLLQNAKYPTRSIHKNISDINAALASLETGKKELQLLVKKHHFSKVHYYMEQLKSVSAQTLKEALVPFKNQSLIAQEFLDDGHQIQVKIDISNDRINFDFEGTSGVHPNNLNANPSIVNSVIIYILRLICNDDRIPLNEGLMKNVSIHIPENSFLSPHFSDDPSSCPAVVGGNTEVSQRLTDTILKAFGLAACSQGTMNNFLFGNDDFGYYETICGGVGAGDGFNGRSAVHQHMTNTKITDPEEMEFRYPVRLWNFEIRKDSGGNGKYRGGDGIIREVAFLDEMNVTILSHHRKEGPYGLVGGENGKTGKQKLIRNNGKEEILNHIDKATVKNGDRIIIETPGGGGYGKLD